MPIFRCFIRGENFVLSMDDKELVLYGFYTTRYVESKDYEAAELDALELLRNDEFWKNLEIKKRSPNAKVYFEEIEEIEFVPEDVPNAGHTFYPMNEEEEK